MTPEGYVQALAEYADAIGDVTPLEQERDALFAKIKSGKEGKTLVNGELNGKQFGWQVSMTLEEKFSAFCQAIKLYNGKVVPMTFAVFSDLVR